MLSSKLSSRSRNTTSPRGVIMSRTTRLRRSSALIRISRPNVLTVPLLPSAVLRKRVRNSSSVSSPANRGSGGVRSTVRRIQPEAKSTTRTSGRSVKWNNRIGPAVHSMIFRARRMASSFGTCSPTTTWRKERRENTATKAMTATAVSLPMPTQRSHGSSNRATNGAPTQPSPRLVKVMPSCAAER